jgi:hypothetical protein
MPQFERCIGIDYSGAETATSRLPGLRVYAGGWLLPPQEVPPPAGTGKYWSRRGIAEWLRDELLKPTPTLVGIDHAFSFPVLYFEAHRLSPDWSSFLDDFQHHWPTDRDHTYVDFILDGNRGDGASRGGDPSWFRLTERWTSTSRSVFQFSGHGTVAKATHAGLPWLRFLRKECKKVHFWPFDGWEIAPGRSVVAEVHSSLWTRRYQIENRTSDQHAAFCVASWMRRTDLEDGLPRYFNPPLEPGERRVGSVEGWILGAV